MEHGLGEVTRWKGEVVGVECVCGADLSRLLPHHPTDEAVMRAVRYHAWVVGGMEE